MAEIDALYNGVQALMSGEISHFILSHRISGDALRRAQDHLDQNQSHLILSRFDKTCYYRESTTIKITRPLYPALQLAWL